MRAILMGLAAILSAALVACSHVPVFPPEAKEGVDRNFDFNSWRATPSTSTGRKVQLGGRILEAQTTSEGILVIGKQLPVVEHPAYGPTDSQKRPGAFEFAFLYPGKLENTALSPGNRFIVIGTTQGGKAVTVDGATRSAPFMVASCVHIWRTRGREIADFSSSGAGYEPLEEGTYCANGAGASTR